LLATLSTNKPFQETKYNIGGGRSLKCCHHKHSLVTVYIPITGV